MYRRLHIPGGLISKLFAEETNNQEHIPPSLIKNKYQYADGPHKRLDIVMRKLRIFFQRRSIGWGEDK